MRKTVIIEPTFVDNDKLGILEKILYIDIASHDKLYLFEETLSKKYNLIKELITHAINRLVDAGMVIIKKDNIGTYIETKQISKFKEFIDEYFKMYNDKAFEILGKRVNGSGKKIYPTWGAKESTLLKKDLEQYGYEELKKYAIIFFNDKVKEVSDFTRYKQKAGYKYTVFHAMIDKIIMANIKVPEPCKYCGQYWGHTKDCKILIERKERELKEMQEIKLLKEQNKNLSLTKMFNEHLGKNII